MCHDITFLPMCHDSFPINSCVLKIFLKLIPNSTLKNTCTFKWQTPKEHKNVQGVISLRAVNIRQLNSSHISSDNDKLK